MKQINNEIKKCNLCDNILILNVNWRLCEKNRYDYICRLCCNKKLRERRKRQKALKPPKIKSIKVKKQRKKENKELANVRHAINRFELRKEVLDYYGNECVCCSEKCWKLLNIDHINGRINENDLTGYRLLNYIKKNNFPKDVFRILCQNCNSCIGHHGFCAHIFNSNSNSNSNSCIFCDSYLNDNNIFNFHKYFKQNICIDCIMNYSIRKYNYASPLQYKTYSKSASLNKKMNIIINYGSKCEICLESNPYFLTIDHINGNGNKHRQELKTYTGTRFYKFLSDNNFPKDDYRLLCYNCNTSKSNYKHITSNITIEEYINNLYAIKNELMWSPNE